MSKNISSKQLIGRIIEDLNLQDISYVDTMKRWIEDAVDIMEIPSYYVYKRERKQVVNGRVSLPCDEKFLSAVLTDINCYVNEDWDRLPYIYGLQRIIIRNNAMLGAGVNIPVILNAFGTINGNFVNMTFDKGAVLFVYKGAPCDNEGFPMVPNDAKVFEAFNFYMIYKLGLTGFKHPVMDWNTAYQLWEKHYPRAANSVNWFSPQEYQEFTEMWNNRLLGDRTDTYEFL